MAYFEAISLFSLCGIYPGLFLGMEQVRLPSIHSWVNALEDLDDATDDHEDELELESVTLQNLLKHTDQDTGLSSKERDSILSLYFASASVSINDRVQM